MEMFLTHKTFLHKVRQLNSPYWNEGAAYRWEYMSHAIDIMKKYKAAEICEAGASDIPLYSRSVLIEYTKRKVSGNMGPYLMGNKSYKHDLNYAPYPFVTKKFDFFVALQVWEHLDCQHIAFNEVKRISRHAILSFPYMWKHGDGRHRGIDQARIARWTCGVKPVSIKQIRDRIVYVWKF